MIVFNQIQALTTWNIMKRAVPGWSSWPISTFITGMLARKKKKKKIWVIIDEIIDHYQDPWFWALSFFFFFVLVCLVYKWLHDFRNISVINAFSLFLIGGAHVKITWIQELEVVSLCQHLETTALLVWGKKKKKKKKKKGSRKHCLKRETDYNTACIIWSCYRRVFPCWWIKPWFCKYS